MIEWRALLQIKKIYLPIVVILLFWFNNSQQDKLAERIQEFTWIASHEPIYRMQKHGIKPKELHPLQLSHLQESLKSPEMIRFSPRIDMANGSNIEVDIANLPYETFSNWLSHLKQNYQLKILQLDIERLNEPGMVHVKISFNQ